MTAAAKPPRTVHAKQTFLAVVWVVVLFLAVASCTAAVWPR